VRSASDERLYIKSSMCQRVAKLSFLKNFPSLIIILRHI
jgi:hypothetical protein